MQVTALGFYDSIKTGLQSCIKLLKQIRLESWPKWFLGSLFFSLSIKHIVNKFTLESPVSVKYDFLYLTLSKFLLNYHFAGRISYFAYPYPMLGIDFL